MSLENFNLYSEEEAREEAFKLQQKIESGKASSYSEAEKLVEKEKLENTINELENLTKKEKLDRKDIEPHLKKVLELLQNEPETIRPRDKNNRPGGVVELRKDLPTLLIPDLHGKREMLFKILTEKNEDGKSNLERLLKNELQIVILGDAVHTESRNKLEEQGMAQNEFYQGNTQKALEILDKEIADSFGTVMMLMKLKELSPNNFHYLRGDHEVQKETYFGVSKGGICQSTLVKLYFENKYGSDFLDKYDEFEESLPLVAIGNQFVASHAPHFKPFTKEEIINFHASLPPGIQKKSDFFEDLTMRRLGRDPDYKTNPSETVTKMLKALEGDEQWVYYFGHTIDDVGWDKTGHLCGLDGRGKPYFITLEIKKPEELIVRYHSTPPRVDPNKVLEGNVYLIEQNSPKKTTLINMEEVSQKGINQENLPSCTPKVEESPLQTSPEKNLPPEQLPTNKQEKIENKQNKSEEAEEKEPKEQKEPKEKKETQKYTPEEIKSRFLEELTKIKDLPNKTELQKRVIYKEARKLIEDWLPFGYLDDFKGINEVMNFMDENRPKTVLTFNYQKEKLAQEVAQEMAFQYKFWEKSNEEKTKAISKFINEWLKDKSYYYQGAEEYKKVLQPPEEMGKPTKVEKWFTEETSALLKLLGQRDKTLSQISQILAMEGVPYTAGIQSLYDQIENQNIKRITVPKLRQIEEMTDKQRLELLAKTKKELGVLPKLPLKLEYYESLISSMKTEDSEKAELMAVCASEISDKINQPEGEEQLEQLKNKAQEVIKKEQVVSQPEAVKNAKEYLKKKESILEKAAGLAGYGLLLFLVLVLLGEIKVGEAITKAGIQQKK